MFSFSPDNDSASAGLVWRHRPVPSAVTDLALAPARGLRIVQHLAQGTQAAFAAHTGCQLATVHEGHSATPCTWVGNLCWPHSPSQPSTSSSTAPVVAPGLYQRLSLLPGPFLSLGLKHPWAPALSTALPSEQQHQCLSWTSRDAAAAAGALQTMSPTVEQAAWAPSPGATQHPSAAGAVTSHVFPAAQSGFGPGPAASSVSSHPGG